MVHLDMHLRIALTRYSKRYDPLLTGIMKRSGSPLTRLHNGWEVLPLKVMSLFFMTTNTERPCRPCTKAACK